MRATNIPSHEADFRKNGIDSDGKKFTLSPFQVPIPGTADSFEAVLCTNGDASFYYKEEVEKKRIVVHHTAGYLKGDVAQLTRRDNHVSVPFVVARDGTIYNLWSSRYWSYHLGKNAAGGNEAMSRSSVAIELSNIGWLKPKGTNLVTYFGDSDVYCTQAEAQYFAKLAAPYRSQSYFATFTDAQYTSLVNLLRYLTATFNIPARFLSEAERYDVKQDVAGFSGITTHVNYQPESYGKWDIGPAFDWSRVIKALQPATGDGRPSTFPLPNIRPATDPAVPPAPTIRT
jgi:N-acetylmuramoyl-L-alanine amidase